MDRMKPPAVPVQPPPVLGEEQLRAMFRACEGTGFEERRDMALLRLQMDTGMRRAECGGLKLADVDLDAEVAVVMGRYAAAAPAPSVGAPRRRSIGQN
jgi:integrase